jgi:hypothetical protein
VKVRQSIEYLRHDSFQLIGKIVDGDRRLIEQIGGFKCFLELRRVDGLDIPCSIASHQPRRPNDDVSGDETVIGDVKCIAHLHTGYRSWISRRQNVEQAVTASRRLDELEQAERVERDGQLVIDMCTIHTKTVEVTTDDDVVRVSEQSAPKVAMTSDSSSTKAVTVDIHCGL